VRLRAALLALALAAGGAPAAGQEADAQTAQPPAPPATEEGVTILPEAPVTRERGTAPPPPDPVEEVVAALSHNQVSITTTYAGSEIFVFGAVKRMAPPRAGRVDVIVTVSGPSEPVAVRRKDRMFGVWANADSVVVDAAPSFYAVAATGPLEEILSQTDDLRHRIALERQVRVIGAAGATPDPDAFRRALIRLRREKGLYVEAPLEVSVIEDTLFTTHVALPANIVEGDYRARVFLVHDREVVDLHESLVDVRKVGLERWIYALSRSDPLVYGLLSLFVALAAGWGASEAFRQLRR
jgi:uncharacterized protein (TIGR02186 family)